MNSIVLACRHCHQLLLVSRVNGRQSYSCITCGWGPVVYDAPSLQVRAYGRNRPIGDGRDQ